MCRRFSDDHRRSLRLLIDGDFPYSIPRVAVSPSPKFLAWPHLEKNGLLCVYSPEVTTDPSDPIGVVGAVLNRASLLIEDIIGGDCDEDFRDEFLTYWNGTVKPESRNILSLVRPRGPTRPIVIWRGRSFHVVADDRDVLLRWLERRGVPTRDARRDNFVPGVLLWLPNVLLPSEYPEVNSDVARLARLAHSTEYDFKEIWPPALSPPLSDISVLLAARGNSGVCFAATSLSRPKNLFDGFRRHRPPSRAVVDRYMSSPSPVQRRCVQRVDREWVHGRDLDPAQETLRRSRVAFVGCGSLGGTAAYLAAQAGVGHLLLVDSEYLEAANASRHLLGIDSRHKRKAEATRDRLLQAFPHTGSVEAEITRLGPSSGALLPRLAECDLVVSTTGNWAAESFLNDHQRTEEGFAPVLYGWIEAHATAAHAVLIKRTGACLRCGREATGRPLLAVTDWQRRDETVPEPACGARFSPYGPAELTWAHALIVRAVLLALLDPPDASHHYIWIGHERTLKRAGGEWTPGWRSTRGEIGLGGFTEDRSWTVDSRCESHGHRLPE